MLTYPSNETPSHHGWCVSTIFKVFKEYSEIGERKNAIKYVSTFSRL